MDVLNKVNPVEMIQGAKQILDIVRLNADGYSPPDDEDIIRINEDMHRVIEICVDVTTGRQPQDVLETEESMDLFVWMVEFMAAEYFEG